MRIERVTEPTGDALPLHLVEELNHRVINEFAEAISMLSLAGQAPAPDAKAAIAQAAARLGAHADAHRALAPPPAGGSVNLGHYVGTLCAAIARSWLADRGVRLTIRADDIWLTTGRSWRIGLIIAELVRNASRHGLAGRAGAIFVRISQGSGVISCFVADTGRGEPGSRPGRGSRLVGSLSAELGGSVKWHLSPYGNLACLQVPTDKNGDT